MSDGYAGPRPCACHGKDGCACPCHRPDVEAKIEHSCFALPLERRTLGDGTKILACTECGREYKDSGYNLVMPRVFVTREELLGIYGDD